MKTMWVVSSGSYSDYRVHAVCESKKTAKTIAARANADKNYTDYAVEELMYIDDPQISKIETLKMTTEIWDDGTETISDDSYVVEWPFDSLYPIVDCTWRWVRAPIHLNKGGRLDVSGTDHERVRKVFSERRALLITDSAFSARREING